MSCDPSQRLLDALRATGVREFVVVSEWLGYLPYGQYIWIEVDGVELREQLPAWDSADLARLEETGAIVQVARVATSDDGLDTRTTYRLGEIPAPSA